jgi:hypothetical protein
MTAAADLTTMIGLRAENEGLRERLRAALQSQASRDWWELQAYDTLAELHETQAELAEFHKALDSSLAQIDAEHDLAKALLIRMRHYIMRHGLLIGECVAWMQLKTRYGIGQSEETDAAWLREYQTRVNVDALPLVLEKEHADG